MIDLVEQLRRGDWLKREAADEIERLRAVIEDMRQGWAKAVDAKHKEIERLKAEIGKSGPHCGL